MTNKLPIVVAIFFGVVLSGCGVTPPPVSQPTSYTQQISTVNADTFLHPADFVRSEQVDAAHVNGIPVAGVVNHHVLASDLLARFFKSVKIARPDIRRFIILSPDHFKRGQDVVSACATNYATQGHLIRVDQVTVEHLHTSSSVALADPALCEHEHGIGALVPFLAREFPNASIVPLVIRSDIPRTRASLLGEQLALFLDENTFLIVSSDMSHYLDEHQALQNDTQTQRWLSTRDTAAIAHAPDDFTDNAPAFVALFSLLKNKNLNPPFILLDHSISSNYIRDKSNVTTYINGVWVQ